MKRFLTLLSALLLTLSVSAQTYSYLTVKTSDGTEKSLSLDGLRLTFSNGSLQAVNTAEAASFSLSDLSSMYFSVNATGIQAVTSDVAASSILGGRLTVDAPAGTVVKVYNVSGQLVGTYVKSASGAETLGGALAHGVYIVRAGSSTSKLLAQ